MSVTVPGPIRVLSEQTINQIAAGEVIENPASVVKELVENAVDAGADQITVETLGGGQQLIRISDNGLGMGADDAVLCLERHATSKIGKAEDLCRLMTMGFRGEALASIAAISKMTLLTALAGKGATCVEVEGGKVLYVEPGARRRGTTVEVRSLFYNVPARKKFQKGASANAAEITKVMTQLALAHPEIGFELVQQEREVFSVPASVGSAGAERLFQRSALLLGVDFQRGSLCCEATEAMCTLQGVIGSPLTHRHNRMGQYLFVNCRPVVCPLISYAIRDAYATRLPVDRHPIYIVHLTLSPEQIDVNVHPQKREIRVREEKRVREEIQRAVRGCLERTESLSIGSILEDLPKPSLFEMRPQTYTEFPLRFQETRAEKEGEFPLLPPQISVVGLFSHYLILNARASSLPGKTFASPGLLLVDLQAAAARVCFESLLRSASTAEGVSQGLLIPLVLSLNLAEAALLESMGDTLKALGIGVNACGKNTFLIDALPPFVAEEEAEQMVRDLIQEMHSAEREKSPQEERLRSLARTTCRFARARKKVFMLQEAEELFKQLLQTSSPFLCPQGKPTVIHMSADEIEAKFFSTAKAP